MRFALLLTVFFYLVYICHSSNKNVTPYFDSFIKPVPVLRAPQLSCQCCPFNASKLWRKTFHGLGPAARAVAEPYFRYDFLLPERQLSATLSYYGSALRLRKFLSNLMSGIRPVKVGLVGGSISYGVCIDNPDEDSYLAIVGRWLRSASGANVTTRNGATSGTPASYMELCLMNSLDPDVDLVFVEYVRNDPVVNAVLNNPVVMTMERLLRRILDLPSKPAVVMVQLPYEKDGYSMYYYTSEHQQRANHLYYDIPTVSPSTAMYQLGMVDRQPGFRFNDLYSNHNGTTRHPGLNGHKLIADSVVHLLQSAVLDLLQRPVGQQERRDWEEPLQAPFTLHNNAPMTSKCQVGYDLPPLVRTNRGFTWVDDSVIINSHKFGYMADKAGSVLELELSTVLPGVDRSAPVNLVTYCLISYDEAMGSAVVSCVEGCSCEDTVINSRTSARYSQAFPFKISMTQSPACRIRFTVMKGTNRPGGTTGQKFKVVGVVVEASTRRHQQGKQHSRPKHKPAGM